MFKIKYKIYIVTPFSCLSMLRYSFVPVVLEVPVNKEFSVFCCVLNQVIIHLVALYYDMSTTISE